MTASLTIDEGGPKGAEDELDASEGAPSEEEHGEEYAEEEEVERAPNRYGPAVLLTLFVCVHFGCQLALLIEALNPVRVVIRAIAFLGSGFLVAVAPGISQGTSTLRPWAFAILVIVAASITNPESSNVVACAAHIAMYASILGPIFWVRRLRVPLASFQRLIFLFWGFYTASAILGVLQTYFPGSFQPALSTVIQEQADAVREGLLIELASGARVYRPMGLSDIPGGAAYGGLYAVLLGLAMLQRERAAGLTRVFSCLSILAGGMCLYLCQVRSLLVMTGICAVTLAAVLAMSGRFSRTVAAGVVVTLGAILAFMLAYSVGGKAVTARLETLTARDATEVYYLNRGIFLEDTINRLLPMYPLGAGLGRWGMVHRYFGGGSEGLWAEIQWTAWLYDGGVPLILAYLGAIVTATWSCFRLALRSAGEELNIWAATLVAYNVGALALCFNYPFFMGTSGIEFWLLNAALLHTAHYSEEYPEEV